jgi:hypothetical protein
LTHQDGGGLYISASSTVVLSDCVIDRNTATTNVIVLYFFSDAKGQEKRTLAILPSQPQFHAHVFPFMFIVIFFVLWRTVAEFTYEAQQRWSKSLHALSQEIPPPPV